jgi:hypothetical protein
LKENKVPKKKSPNTDAINVNVPRTREQDRAALRRKVENFYDIQRLRMQTAGRTYKRADGTEIQLNEIDVHILNRRAKALEAEEKLALKDVEDHLKTISFYNDVLNDKKLYRGIGPTIAGVILSAFDIDREDTVSKMWAFAGLRPIDCKRCRHCHAIVEADEKHLPAAVFYNHTKERVRLPTPPKPGEEVKATLPKCPMASIPLTDEDVYDSGHAQHPIKGQKLNYNAWLRTKLVGVLAGNLIKLKSPWRMFYDDYKHRKVTAGWGRSDGHRHQAAMRYMIKMLLLDIHHKWRVHEGLSVRPGYHIEKQGGHQDNPMLPSEMLAQRGMLKPAVAEPAAEVEQAAEVA